MTEVHKSHGVLNYSQFLPSQYTLEEPDDHEFTVSGNSLFQLQTTLHEAQVPYESNPIYLFNETVCSPGHIVPNDEMIN